MEKYDLLKNEVYLYCLFNTIPGDKLPCYTDLAFKIGKTRQTVSTKVKQLVKQGIIKIEINNENEKSIEEVLNIYELDLLKGKEIYNKYKEDIIVCSVVLYCKLICSSFLISELCEKLNITQKGLWTHGVTQEFLDGFRGEENEIRLESIVYGIVWENELKYIGSSEIYQERISAHIRKRPFLTKENFIVLKRVERKYLFETERSLIRVLQPEWNVMGE